MILLELAAQGVRGVSPAGGRATLRPGYNVVAADGAALRRLIEAMLYPDPHDGDALPKASGATATPLRAGITLTGNDNATYRLVRDFAASCQLHKFDPAKRAFALVSQDLAEIAQFLRSQVGVPPPGQLSALLSLSASELPSKQAPGGMGGARASASPRQPLDPAQAKAKIAALKAELERAKTAEKLQYQLDGLQTKMFKLEETLREGQKLKGELEAAQGALVELAPLVQIRDQLGGDPAAKLALFEKAASKREESMGKIADERQALEDRAAMGKPAPLWNDTQFLAGAGAGLAAVAAAVFGGPGLRYVALVDIPAFGFAAWRALVYIGQLEGYERLGRRRKMLEEREKKVDDQLARESGAIKAAMAALNVSSPNDLRDAFARLTDAQAAAEDRAARLEVWGQQPDTKNAQAEKARIEDQIHAIEEKLQSEAGGYVRDPRTVEMEMARLEQDLAAGPAPAAAPAPVSTPGVEAIRGLLERAAKEWSQSAFALGKQVEARMGQMLQALSAQRFGGCSFDERGGLSVSQGGKPSPGLTLPAADRDLCYLALKLALIERALAAGKLLAVAEDAFAGLPESARRMAARMMKQLAKPGQILHATSDPAFREMADNSA